MQVDGKRVAPLRSSAVMSKTCSAYAPVAVAASATRVPLTQTSAAPTTPFSTSRALCPAGGEAKSVRYHQGALNRAMVSGPTVVIWP